MYTDKHTHLDYVPALHKNMQPLLHNKGMNFAINIQMPQLKCIAQRPACHSENDAAKHVTPAPLSLAVFVPAPDSHRHGLVHYPRHDTLHHLMFPLLPHALTLHLLHVVSPPLKEPRQLIASHPHDNTLH